MADRFQELEGKLSRLAAELEEVRARVRVLEGDSQGLPASQPTAADSVRPAARSSDDVAGRGVAGREADGERDSAPGLLLPELNVAAVMTALGRTCLVLAGAFLLRALTDAGTLPQGIGVVAGLAYAAAWAIFADRAGAADAKLSAAFHGVTSCVIAYPLLWEATAGFGLLSPAVGAAGVVLFSALGFVVAWRARLQLLGWATTASALVTCVGLSFATHAIVEQSAALLLVGLGSLWLAELRDWPALRWPLALAADFLVISVVMLATREGGAPEAYQQLSPLAPLVLPLALLVGYLASFVVQALLRERTLGLFESLQGVAVLAVGLIAVVRAAPGAHLSLVVAGAVAVVIAVGFYACAFGLLERRQGRGINYVYFGVVGVVLILFGSALLSSGAVVGVAWAVLGATAAVLSWRFDRFTLRAHGAAYVVAAAVATEMFVRVYHALLGGAAKRWEALSFDALLVVAAAAGSYVLMVAARKGALRWYQRLPGFFAALVAVLGAAAVLVGTLVAVLRHGSTIDPALLAAARTGVLASAAIALALLGRGERLRELGWLVYPVLVVGGFKLVGEDLRQGTAATLTAGFVMYGAALILGPRLLRQTPANGERPLASTAAKAESASADSSDGDEPEGDDADEAA